MVAKYGILLAILLVGGFAFPAVEDDMSIFFDHTVSDFQGRIVGGVTAPEGSWPWAVALSNGLIFRSFFCGGSLVNRRTVLSAAHCIAHVVSGNSLSSSVRAHLGTNRWNSGGQTHTLQRHIIHPNYVQATIKNDIGFLVTSSDVTLNDRVSTIALNYDWVAGGVPARVAGWGRVRTGGSLSNVLMQLGVSTIDGNQCMSELARMAGILNIRAPAVDPQIELCTFHSVNHGTCNGDSGSSLVRNSNNQQIGIVSWGLPCARGAPDMFVRVSAYRNWIQSVL